ncbi:LysR family transcriptional regulator [Variovorax sp. GB1P17]|uniref:LysR family transcriptional regulator n=1 Tax=Variovorax sp. GB1P17 TaxID=3443740 RepID=UPI003F4698AD
MKALDIEAVQAFVRVADLKSFTRAAEAMDSAQSAVSLKVKRLEEVLGRRLLERTPRSVRLSAEGLAFLPSARKLLAAHSGALESFGVQQRRLVVGMSHHVVGAELPLLLRRMRDAEPLVVIEVRVSTSRELLDAFDRGGIDAVVILRHDSRRLDGELLLEEQFGWMAAPDFVHRSGEPLRLATQAEPCSVRSMAVATLAEGKVPWTEVFVGGGVLTVGAAVSAGLAVAALGRRVAPLGTIDVGPMLGLPPLPSRDVVLHTSVSDPQGRSALRSLSAAIRSTAV